MKILTWFATREFAPFSNSNFTTLLVLFHVNIRLDAASSSGVYPWLLTAFTFSVNLNNSGSSSL